MNLALWGDDEETQKYVHENFDDPANYFKKMNLNKSNDDDNNDIVDDNDIDDDDNDADLCTRMPKLKN